MEDPELQVWHLRDEGSFAQIEVGGTAIGDQLPDVRVMGLPKHG